MALRDLKPLDRELRDDDILVIEGGGQTYSVQLKDLKDYFAISIDKRMVDMEKALKAALLEVVSTASDKADTLARVYYSLARNWNMTDQSIEALKELIYANTAKEEENP